MLESQNARKKGKKVRGRKNYINCSVCTKRLRMRESNTKPFSRAVLMCFMRFAIL